MRRQPEISISQKSDWTRRRFLGMGLVTATALLIPRVLVHASGSGMVSQRRDLWAMGGWNHLRVECDRSDATHAALGAMVESIRRIDRMFSVFDSRSQLSRLNHDTSLCVPVDDLLLLGSIDESLRWSSEFEGAFDPTVEPIMRRWGFRDEHASTVNEEARSVRDWDFRRIECDMAHGRIMRESAAINLDSGGWAKGLAAELAADAALRAGAVSAQVSCGGDIFRAGREPLWECVIRDPLRCRTGRALSVRHRYPTVATSANMETFRISPSGRHIGHLMDPRTGCPVESDLLSASVFGNSGLAVDAASSALFVMGRSRATRWLLANSQFAGVMIDRTWPDQDSVALIGELEVERI